MTGVDEQSIGRVEGGEFAGNTLDYAALDSRYPYQVGVPQARVEEILEDRIAATVTDTLPWDDVQAVLMRPDGYVCWTAPGEEMTGAFRKWFESGV